MSTAPAPLGSAAPDRVCVPASRWQVLGMALMPPILLGGMGGALTFAGEGWQRALGLAFALAGVALSFMGRRLAERLRVVVDEDGARVVDGWGRVAALAGASWTEVASAGLELRGHTDARGEPLLVLKNVDGRDCFQFSRQLCAPDDAHAVVTAIRRRMLRDGKPVNIPPHWP